MYWVSICGGTEEVASWIGDGEDGVTDGAIVPDSTGEGVETTGAVEPDSIGEGVETTGEGVETIGADEPDSIGEGVETTGAVEPDSIGDGVETTGEGVETTGAVEPDSIGEGVETLGGLTGTEDFGALLVAGGLGGEQVDDGPGVHSKFIPTMPICTLGPDGELGWTQTSCFSDAPQLSLFIVVISLALHIWWYEHD